MYVCFCRHEFSLKCYGSCETYSANGTGVTGADSRAHRDAGAEQSDPGADEAAGGAQLCLEVQCWRIRAACRRWNHAGLNRFE
jgi:hypothetical protein